MWSRYFSIALGILFVFSTKAFAHDGVSGRVVSALDEQPLISVLVIITETNDSTYTDQFGKFLFAGKDEGRYHCRAVKEGYEEKEFVVNTKADIHDVLVILEEKILELKEIEVTSDRDFNTTTRSAIDLKLRPHNSTQDFLRMVPGLFIAQHAGGGKAEQIFLRGFDVDHGTDVNLTVDGMPVNMVSHAHGQGYSDLHFVIPETVDKMNITLGPHRYDAGDFATAGSIGLTTVNAPDKNVVKLEGGCFNTLRGMTLFNLLRNNNQNAYIASEYHYTNGYFESPQDFNRFNIFGKYSGNISEKMNLEASVSAFSSNWDASGQVPDRAVRSNMISRFGSIDNTEGGQTSRYNVNVILRYTLSPGAELRNQVFYSRYNFKLYSNFTFFLRDSSNGDQIMQAENRNIIGYNVAYSNKGTFLGIPIKTTIGAGLRYDQILDNELSATVQRMFLSNIVKGDVYETNLNALLNETFYFSSVLTLNAALRYDHFFFQYNNHLRDTLYSGVNKGILNPKLSLYYTPTSRIQFFFKAGSGFHSNDARVVVLQQADRTLPRAVGADVGLTTKVIKNLVLNTTLWTLYLQNEFVYVGDEGIVEVNGETRRLGVDVSVRYQLLKGLYADLDLNVTDPRYLGVPGSENYVPLAPVLSSIGGVTAKLENGFSGSIRYRCLANRPANEDYSVIAQGYFINDVLIRYTGKLYEAVLSVENLFNVKWKEAQFDTESRLQNEAQSVSEIHYTPGIPLFIKMGLSYLF